MHSPKNYIAMPVYGMARHGPFPRAASTACNSASCCYPAEVSILHNHPLHGNPAVSTMAQSRPPHCAGTTVRYLKPQPCTVVLSTASSTPTHHPMPKNSPPFTIPPGACQCATRALALLCRHGTTQGASDPGRALYTMAKPFCATSTFSSTPAAGSSPPLLAHVPNQHPTLFPPLLRNAVHPHAAPWQRSGGRVKARAAATMHGTAASAAVPVVPWS